MSLFRLALAYLASRPLLSALNAAMLALDVPIVPLMSGFGLAIAAGGWFTYFVSTGLWGVQS